LRQKALVVPNKAERVYNFHRETLKTLKELVEAAGLHHPSEIKTDHIIQRINKNEVRLLSYLLPEMPAGLLLKGEHINPSLNLPRVFELYWNKAQAKSFVALKD
jgi:hypothetical protein